MDDETQPMPAEELVGKDGLDEDDEPEWAVGIPRPEPSVRSSRRPSSSWPRSWPDNRLYQCHRPDRHCIAGTNDAPPPIPDAGTAPKGRKGGGGIGLQPGDRVLGSPTIVDGTCRYCREGLFPCESGTGAFGFSPAFWPWGGEIQGAQSEMVRVPLASGTLTKMPEAVSGAEHDPLMLTVVDVMSTGWHCATAAALKAGDATLVIGDGAVGLCAVHAAALKGAAQVICLGHHDDRLAIAEQLGATTVINSRDNSEVRERVMQLTRGEGVPAVLQTISGTTMELSQTCARHGGVISCVGADQFVGKAVEVDWVDQFMRNLTITGGITPYKRYRQELAELGAEGRLESNLVFTHTLPLKDAPEGYRMMAERAEGVVKVALSPEG